MAEHSSPPGNQSGSDDLSDQFHPAYEFLDNANANDDDEDDIMFDPETGTAEPLIYFDVDVEVADDDDDDEDYEVEDEEEDEDDDNESPRVMGRGSAEDDERILAMGAMIAQETAHEDEDEDEDEEEGEEDEEEEEEEEEDLRQSEGARMLRLLNARGLQALLRSHGLFAGNTYIIPGGGGGDDDDDNGLSYGSGRFQRRRTAARYPPPKIPSEKGRALMNSGFYGNNPSYADESRRRKKKLATRLMWRELGVGTPGEIKREIRSVYQDLIPSTKAEKIINLGDRCYSGQFSDDGNFFFCCTQDFKVYMYDTSNPHDWKYYKTVRFIGGQWTITDATLSPDNKWLAASSIQRQVTLAPTDPNDKSEPLVLDFAPNRRHYGRFGIWSLRFSGDGREIVAGTTGTVIVYDIERQTPILELDKHEDDVNAVCFGDSSSPHILYSGSDDTTIRVWDRRSMNDSREAGAFIGHTEGLTYVDSKGDGRYVLSNGKDQSMKLWDLRKMVTTEQFAKINISKYTTGFDYRYLPIGGIDYKPHPHDCSVVTYRGHKVLRTLIRCHFSPPSSTNSRYVYSGSYDGKVYVYNIDATLAGVIDVDAAASAGRGAYEREAFSQYDMGLMDDVYGTVVRDVSWHPSAPILAASCWNNNGESSGSCSVHSWNDSASDDDGDPPMGTQVDEKLRPWMERRNRRYHQRF